MSVTLVNFDTGEGMNSYSSKAYLNYEIFQKLFGGSPSDWAHRLTARDNPNWDRIQLIAKKADLALDYVAGINLSDECINYQSAAHLQQYLNNWGCTSIAINNVIGQTLDLFTVELCLIREGDCFYVTMPPYLCLFGMGKNITMCTNHLFDPVSFDGMPISHIRRTLLDMASLDESIKFLTKIKPTTSVNFVLSDGNSTLDIELSKNGLTLIEPTANKLAHTNHIVGMALDTQSSCLRLKTASLCMQQNNNIEKILTHPAIVQNIDLTTQFGTIITAWMDPKLKTFSYKEPFQTTFQTIDLKH